jgi:thiol-disulfide isomerase/thioredoxin
MQQLMKNEISNYFSEIEVEKAFLLAKQKQVPVFIDFWAPNCKGCKKMEITAYQNPEVLSYIDEHFVFVKYDITNRKAPKIECSPILWTPTFIIFSNDGSEVRKITGYLNHFHFVAELEIGRAMAFLRKAQPNTALQISETFIANTANLPSIPEALYGPVWSHIFSIKGRWKAWVPIGSGL